MTTPRNGKATHLGTCQACGRFQKLPSGVLAVHGYTTRWGFFSGACAGSGRKPFENSTDYIAEGITNTTRRAAVLREEAATVRSADVTGTKEFWFHQYVPATWRVRHSSSRGTASPGSLRRWATAPETVALRGGSEPLHPRRGAVRARAGTAHRLRVAGRTGVLGADPTTCATYPSCITLIMKETDQ
jgi:hypothetical protein